MPRRRYDEEWMYLRSRTPSAIRRARELVITSLATLGTVLLFGWVKPSEAKIVHLVCSPKTDSLGGVGQRGFIVDTDDGTVFSAYRVYGKNIQHSHPWKGENRLIESMTSCEIVLKIPDTFGTVAYKIDRSTLEVKSPY